MPDTVIKVENLSKRYRIGERQPYKTIRESLVNAFKAPFHRSTVFGHPSSVIDHPSSVAGPRSSVDNTLWALKDVSFEIKQGEVVGIIGRNGAGKSTLLKILSRITEPTEGRVELKGRVGSLLEVGTGFHPELTGHENTYLYGAILGMDRWEVTRKFDEIVAFAELEKFINTPVKHYSSGMYMRLAFAVAAHLETEILLVDEVLAVGDAQFQKKSLGKMGNMTQQGRTVLFVSHNMAAVENLCRSAVVLDQGQIRFVGTQTAAISEYQRSFSSNQVLLKHRTDRKGSGEVRVVGIDFRDVEGRMIDSVVCGQDFDVVFHFKKLPGFRSNRVVASFIVKTQWDVPVFLHHNRMTGTQFDELPSEGAFVCRIHKTPLTPSTYRIDYSIMLGDDYLDSINDAADLNVIAGDFFSSGEVPPSSHGICLIEGHWSLES